jgi:hypothetical protein
MSERANVRTKHDSDWLIEAIRADLRAQEAELRAQTRTFLYAITCEMVGVAGVVLAIASPG